MCINMKCKYKDYRIKFFSLCKHSNSRLIFISQTTKYVCANDYWKDHTKAWHRALLTLPIIKNVTNVHDGYAPNPNTLAVSRCIEIHVHAISCGQHETQCIHEGCFRCNDKLFFVIMSQFSLSDNFPHSHL